MAVIFIYICSETGAVLEHIGSMNSIERCMYLISIIKQNENMMPTINDFGEIIESGKEILKMIRCIIEIKKIIKTIKRFILMIGVTDCIISCIVACIIARIIARNITCITMAVIFIRICSIYI